MGTDADHHCQFCDLHTRVLYRTAEQTASAVQDALNAPGNWSRAVALVNELHQVIDDLRPALDTHWNQTVA